MDADRFDWLARRLVGASSRRQALRGAAGGALVLAGASLAPDEIEGRSKRRCPKSRSCDRRCCKSGQICIGGTCYTPCTGSACGSFPGGCSLFPANNIWNTPIDSLDPDPKSDDYIASIGAERHVHADFGSGLWDGGPIGIPFTVVPGTQPGVNVSFYYPDESDPGPYPVPPTAPIEGGIRSDGDRHILVIDQDNCVLYELYDVHPKRNGSYDAGSGAIFDLNSNALRQDGWTSADAAGLPIFAGLVRYDEAGFGPITHALRFTAPRTRNEYVWPARHQASSDNDPDLPPMGQRFRLKSEFDISSFSTTNQRILTALKTYGMVLADNGSAWYLSGVPDERWDNDDLHELDPIKGSDFEAVDVSSLMVDPDSGQAGG